MLLNNGTQCDFEFGEKVYWYDPVAGVPMPKGYIRRGVVIGSGMRGTEGSDCLQCMESTGGITLVHPRMLEKGWGVK